MALPRFFDRAYSAAGWALSVSRTTLERALATHRVAVVCGPECESDGNERWIAEFVVNLLARMYPAVTIAAYPAFRAHAAKVARRINPSIEIIDGVSDSDVAVVIGKPDGAPREAVFAGATGWVAHLHGAQFESGVGHRNPLAAGAAGCLAAAEVFRRVFKDRLPVALPFRDVQVSLLDYGEATGTDLEIGELDVGEVAFFGLGAVANGALWALSRIPRLRGRAWLVDDETIDLFNLQRYVLAGDSDEGRPKVDLAREALAASRLEVNAHQELLEKFADRHPGGLSIPTVCVSVDDVAGRRNAQALLPRLVINGWTGDGALGASWHEFFRDAACLACLYHPTGPAPSQTELVAKALGLPHDRAALLWVNRAPLGDEELRTVTRHLGATEEGLGRWRGRPINDLYRDVVCGAVSLDLLGLGRVETVPLAHQSALAGILMAAELVKRTDAALARRCPSDTLAVWDDVLRPPPRRWLQVRSRVPGCICGDPAYQEAYAAKWGAQLAQTGSR